MITQLHNDMPGLSGKARVKIFRLCGVIPFFYLQPYLPIHANTFAYTIIM